MTQEQARPASDDGAELKDQVTRAVHGWLDEAILVTARPSYVVVSTPFLNHCRDCIEVYVERDGDNFLVRDYGEAFGELELCGLDSQKVAESRALRDVAEGLGVTLRGGEFSIGCPAGRLGMAVLEMVQVMLFVDSYLLHRRG